MFDMFAGGARKMTIFALNIMPYISASYWQLSYLSSFEQLKKGELGRKKLINMLDMGPF